MIKKAHELRLRKRELFRMLGYEPHPAQLLVHKSSATRRIVACGARFGKSTAAAAEVVAALMEPRPRSIGWLVAPTYDLTSRIFTMACEYLRRAFDHHIVQLSPREHRIVVYNLGGGVSELRAKSADNPTSLLGEGLDWLVVDEAAKLRDEVWERYLSARLVDKHGWSLCVSTPAGVNWFYREFGRGLRDPTYACWTLPSSANPYLDPAMIDAQRATLPADVFRQEFEAVFLGAEKEPCDRCGGPSPSAQSVILLRYGEELSRCPECNRVVDVEGRTLVHRARNGAEGVTVLTRRGGSEFATPLPLLLRRGLGPAA
jgi:hypothetical protein